MLVIIGLLLGLAIKHVAIGIIIGLVFGLLASGMVGGGRRSDSNQYRLQVAGYRLQVTSKN